MTIFSAYQSMWNELLYGPVYEKIRIMGVLFLFFIILLINIVDDIEFRLRLACSFKQYIIALFIALIITIIILVATLIITPITAWLLINTLCN